MRVKTYWLARARVENSERPIEPKKDDGRRSTKVIDPDALAAALAEPPKLTRTSGPGNPWSGKTDAVRRDQ